MPRGAFGRRVAPAFVGRSVELDRLAALVAAPSALVVIQGEAGVGKSRLVDELLRRPGLDGRTHLVAQCEPLSEPILLGPLLEAIRAAIAVIPARARLDPLVGALVPLVPELGERLPPAAATTPDQRVERNRVLRAACALLDHVGPAVLVVEDVHWADAGTREFLAVLAGAQPSELAVVCTLRDDNPPLTELWAALARARGHAPDRLVLPPLGRHEVGDLAASVLGTGPLSEPFVQALLEKTAGIPFVVEEVARTLAAGPAGSSRSSGVAALRDLEVPTALRDVLLQRLGGLDPAARDVLDAAAVVGVAPDERLLGDLLGLDGGAVARALARALAIGLLHDEDGNVAFRHALARQVVYEAIPPPTRRHLHRTVAAALSERVPRPVAQLAHHYREAGDDQDAVRCAEDAADLALAHGDDATAARHLLATVDVAGIAMPTRVRLAGKLARAAVDGLAQHEAVPIVERLLDHDELPPAARGELRLMLGRLLRQQGAALEGYRQIELAVEDLVDQPALAARALAILSVPQTVAGRHVDTHLARSREAAAAAQRGGDADVRLAVEIAAASLHLELGGADRWDRVDALLGSDLLLARPREQLRACINFAQGALDLGELRRTQSLLDVAAGAGQSAEYPRVAGVLELVQAALDLSAGRWAGLEPRLRAIEGGPHDFPATGLEVHYLLAALLASVGQVDDAEARLRTVLVDADRVQAVWSSVRSRATLASLLVATGRPAEALAVAENGFEHVRRKGLWTWGPELVVVMTDALIVLGRPAQAHGLVAELGRGLTAVTSPPSLAGHHLARGSLASIAGDHEGAVADASAAVHALAAEGLTHATALARSRLGAIRCAAGQSGAADLEEALRALAELGAERDLATVRRTMRTHGIPVPYPWRGGRRSYGANLSPREREVASLAAQGLTNEAIATRMFLSRRTVESHVANALRKLGRHSRRDLASASELRDEPG